MLESQSSKRRKAEDYKARSTPNIHLEKALNPTCPRKKAAMWIGYFMHEALAIHSGKHIVKERRTNEDFTTFGTPASDTEEFHMLRRAFSRTK